MLEKMFTTDISYFKNKKQDWLDAPRHYDRKDFKISFIAWASLWILFKLIQLFYA